MFFQLFFAIVDLIKETILRIIFSIAFYFIASFYYSQMFLTPSMVTFFLPFMVGYFLGLNKSFSGIWRYMPLLLLFTVPLGLYYYNFNILPPTYQNMLSLPSYYISKNVIFRTSIENLFGLCLSLIALSAFSLLPKSTKFAELGKYTLGMYMLDWPIEVPLFQVISKMTDISFYSKSMILEFVILRIIIAFVLSWMIYKVISKIGINKFISRLSTLLHL
jgi:hypothetical protein